MSLCFSAVLSSHLLGEVLNVVGKLGCLLCVLGSILLVIHAPQEQEVTSLQDMTNKLLEPGERGSIQSVCVHAVHLVSDSFLRCPDVSLYLETGDKLIQSVC